MAGPDDAYQPVAQSKRERGEKRVARQPERYTFHEPFSSAYTVPCASFSQSTFAAFLLLFPSSIACYTAIHSLVGERKKKKKVCWKPIGEDMEESQRFRECCSLDNDARISL